MRDLPKSRLWHCLAARRTIYQETSYIAALSGSTQSTPLEPRLLPPSQHVRRHSGSRLLQSQPELRPCRTCIERIKESHVVFTHTVVNLDLEPSKERGGEFGQLHLSQAEAGEWCQSRETETRSRGGETYLRPMHLRLPTLNGLNASLRQFFSSSVVVSSHRSGRNTSGSGNARGSRWTV